MLGLRRHTVRLESHDPTWQASAREIIRQIGDAAGIPLTRILHIGSTAVPNLHAKPILDIDLVLLESDNLGDIVARLTRLGFLDRGQKDGGVGHLLVREVAPEIRTVHVHVLDFASDAWRRDLAFRDALRADPDLRGRYAALKAGLAEQFGADRASYRQGKNAFFREVLGSLVLHGGASVRRLGLNDGSLYRDIRAEALRTDPDAFGERFAVFNRRSDQELRSWFAECVGSTAQGILITEVDGRPRAMCGFGVKSEAPSVGYLWGMFVSPSMRRRGLGERLVREATQYLAVLGAERVEARVAVPINGAIRFYENVGFLVGEKLGMLREGSQVPVYHIELSIDGVLS